MFIEKYLSTYELLVDYLIEDNRLHCENANGIYALGYDYENHVVKTIYRYSSKGIDEIDDKEIIDALNVISHSVYYPVSTIHMTAERITFLSAEGVGGIIYMRSNGKPSYFISPDEKSPYRLYKNCDHWYRAVMRLR